MMDDDEMEPLSVGGLYDLYRRRRLTLDKLEFKKPMGYTTHFYEPEEALA